MDASTADRSTSLPVIDLRQMQGDEAAETAIGRELDDAFREFGFCYIANTGIDPAVQPIPVAPACHYHMGGIATDAEGRTSLPGLYAAGDIARAPHSVSWAVADGVTAGTSLHRALVFGG